MITTPFALVSARRRWRGDMLLFRITATVLDGAICEADIRAALSPPRFLIIRAATGAGWEIHARGLFMLTYTLSERETDAEVSILA